MTQSISVNFVEFVESIASQAVGGNDGDDGLPWRSPALQILDIQSYGGHDDGKRAMVVPIAASLRRAPTADQETRRFYVALHDTRGVVWAVAPPGGQLEGLITRGEADIGSLLVLAEYAVVTAANQRRVLVVLEASTAPGLCFSLMGAGKALAYDTTLFHFSQKSLIARHERQRQQEEAALALGSQRRKESATAEGRGSTQRPLSSLQQMPLRRLWAEYADLMRLDTAHAWHVLVRIHWKSKLRRIVSSTNASSQLPSGGFPSGMLQGAGGDDDASLGAPGKYVFDVTAVDARGDAIKIAFIGKRWFDLFECGDCVRVSGGAVHVEHRSRALGSKWPRHNDSGPLEYDDPDCMEVPTLLHVPERARVELVTPEEVSALSPEDAPADHVSEYLSGAEHTFANISEILHHGVVGDVVSARGIVTKCSDISDVPTRHGRVSKRTLAVRDLTTSHSTEITLWGPIALSTSGVRLGTVWCFRSFTLRIYGNARTLSSRSSSELFPHISQLGGEHTQRNNHRRAAGEISLTYDQPSEANATTGPTTASSTRARANNKDITDGMLPQGQVATRLTICDVYEPILFDACPKCSRSLTDLAPHHNQAGTTHYERSYQCSHCHHHTTRSEPQFKVRMRVLLAEDSERSRSAAPSSQLVVAFGDAAVGLIGESPRHLVERIHASHDTGHQILKAILDRLRGCKLCASLVTIPGGDTRILTFEWA